MTNIVAQIELYLNSPYDSQDIEPFRIPDSDCVDMEIGGLGVLLTNIDLAFDTSFKCTHYGLRDPYHFVASYVSDDLQVDILVNISPDYGRSASKHWDLLGIYFNNSAYITYKDAEFAIVDYLRNKVAEFCTK